MDDARPDKGLRQHALLIAILMIGLVVRLGWGLTRPADEASLQSLPDQREYLELARNLLHERTLSFRDDRMQVVVRAFRMSGYPAFLAMNGADAQIARVAQAMLDVSSALAAYILARRWLSVQLSLVAAGLVACNPFLIYFSGLLLSETLFTAMLAWAMVFLALRGTPVERWRAGLTWAAGVALLALSIHVRPSAVGLPLTLGVFAVFANRDPHACGLQRRWPFPIAATALALTLLSLTPWAFRNYQVVGTWIWTTTNSGFTAYDGFNADATGASDQRFVRDMPQLVDMTEVERSRYLNERAKEFIAENSGKVIALAGKKIARTWSPLPLSEDFSKPLYIAAALAFAVPFDLLVLVGLWRTNRSAGAYHQVATTAPTPMNSTASALPRAAKVLLLMPALYLTVIHAISVGSLRYRIPAEVPMAVIAASGAGMVCRKGADHHDGHDDTTEEG